MEKQKIILINPKITINLGSPFSSKSITPLVMKNLIIFIAVIVVEHAGADPNKKAQEQINQVMSEAMKSSDLPTVVAVGIDSKGNQFDFMHGGLSWARKKKSPGTVFSESTQ